MATQSTYLAYVFTKTSHITYMNHRPSKGPAPWKGRRIMNRNQLANCCLFFAFYVNNTLFCIVWVFLYCFGHILLGICGTFLGIFCHKRVYRLGLTLPFLNTSFSYLVFIITILECVTCRTDHSMVVGKALLKALCKLRRARPNAEGKRDMTALMEKETATGCHKWS